MSLSNPTPLRIRSKGTLFGNNYEIVGRVVFGVEEEGETYFWHEFVLMAEDGNVAFLDFENDDGRIEWKFMQPFVPDNLLSDDWETNLEEGHTLTLDQPGIEVTQVNTSTVHLVEGDNILDMHRWEKNRYADAEKGRKVYSIESDGESVEYFRGVRMSTKEVAEAFGLQKQFAGWGEATGGSSSSGCLVLVLALLGILFLAFVSTGGWSSGSGSGTNSIRSGSWYRGGGWSSGK